MRVYNKRTSDEKELVSRDETGHATLHTQFEALFHATKDRLHHFALKLTGNPTAAQDLLQDAYTRLWEKLPTLDTGADVLPLLLTYARNTFIDQLRKRKQDARFLEQLTGVPDRAPAAAEATLEMKDTLQQLHRSLEQLPARRREIFSLVKEQGFSHKEVAAQLGIAPGTVEKQVGLSLQFLRKELNTGDM